MKSWRRQLHRVPRYSCLPPSRQAKAWAWLTQPSPPFTFAPPPQPGGTGTRRQYSCSVARSALPPHPRSRPPDFEYAETIYALSTAPGPAAIAVVRISGPACLGIYRRLCPDKPLPVPRKATLRKLYDPAQRATSAASTGNGEPPRILDSGALVLFFPAPNTATGESILELHLHGGPAIVKSVLEAISRSGDAGADAEEQKRIVRPAEPGEFTMRAFYNGRLTLTQAEALGEVLAAETEQQRRLAVLGTESGLTQRYEEWRRMLLHARGELEALIDFSEDQHFDESPAELMASTANQVAELERLISIHIQNASKGELLRNGISIALLGAPNAGKSSLLNRIVGREAAIVSSEAGTTRDIVDVSIDLNGWLCRLGDMAGLRKGLQTKTSVSPSATREDGFEEGAVSPVEKEGIRRARERALQSDIILAIIAVELGRDGTTPVISINQELADAVRECKSAGKEIIFVLTKGDLLVDGDGDGDGDEGPRHQVPRFKALLESEFPSAVTENTPIFVISCLNNAHIGPSSDPGNIQGFLHGLSSVFSKITASSSSFSSSSASTESPSISAPHDQSYWSASLSITHRQKAHLEQCLSHLHDFLSQAKPLSPSPSTSTQIDDGDGSAGDVDIVTAAEHLRYAASCLAKITGKGEGGDVEDVLGVVFEKFCVGK